MFELTAMILNPGSTTSEYLPFCLKVAADSGLSQDAYMSARPLYSQEGSRSEGTSLAVG